jgi:hypothetical protein
MMVMWVFIVLFFLFFKICLKYSITKGPLETGFSFSLYPQFTAPILRTFWHGDITLVAVISHL